MENNISNKVEKSKCCGCGACFNACPKNAISMKENEEGFLFPVIDTDKCINCGLCVKSCPILNTNNSNTHNPECYAVMANDEIRMKSSSGGMFTLLAEYVLDKGGYVCGAAYDKDWSVHHIIINKKEDLDKLRGSKYFQSNTTNCFKEIKALLVRGKSVMFSGTPCQIAGLNAYLHKEYDNLITVEILCHGTPSYKTFIKFLEDEKIKIENISNINFRDKSVKWRSDYLTIKTGDEIYQKNIPQCSYEKGFHAGLFNRLSCTPCKFAQLPRQADFTIADWWGISKFAPEMNDNLGTSLVLINNDKAKFIFSDINTILYRCKQIDLENAKKSVNVTIYRPLDEHKKRKMFFRQYDKIKLNKNVMSCIDNKFDVCLVSIFYGNNYGSMLVSYACNKIIEDLGYTVLMLEKPNFIWSKYEEGNTIARQFAQRHYNLSKHYNSIEHLSLLNNHCKSFVTASDQMFNPILNIDFAFLEFVNINKNKIAFATSFGNDSYDVNDNRLEKNKRLLKKFSHIGLREKSDNLCKNIFDIKADELIDPTLIYSLEKYIQLIKDVNISLPDKYILTYFLDLNDEKIKAIKYVSEKLGMKLINIQNIDIRQRIWNTDLEYKKDYTPEEFLYLYMHSSFVLTDSYHGTCFATKFNKQFISFLNIKRGKFRYKIFEELGLKQRIVENVSDIYNLNDIFCEFDFNNVNKIIEKKSNYAINWIKSAIENNVNENRYSEQDVETDLLLKQLRLRISNLDNEINNLNNKLNKFINKPKSFTYYRYKILSKITFGKMRKHYKRKYNELKN